MKIQIIVYYAIIGTILCTCILAESNAWLAIYDKFATPWPWFTYDGFSMAQCEQHSDESNPSNQVRTSTTDERIECELPFVVLKQPHPHEQYCPVTCESKVAQCAVPERCPKLILYSQDYNQGNRKSYFRYPYFAVCTSGSPHAESGGGSMETTGTLCDFKQDMNRLARHLSTTSCNGQSITVKNENIVVNFGETIYVKKMLQFAISITGFPTESLFNYAILEPTTASNRSVHVLLDNQFSNKEQPIMIDFNHHTTEHKELQFVLNVSTSDRKPLAMFVAYIRLVKVDLKTLVVGVNVDGKAQVLCHPDIGAARKKLWDVNTRARIDGSLTQLDKLIDNTTDAKIVGEGNYTCHLQIQRTKTCFPFEQDYDDWVTISTKEIVVSNDDIYHPTTTMKGSNDGGLKSDLPMIAIVAGSVSALLLLLFVLVFFIRRNMLKKKKAIRKSRVKVAEPSPQKESRISVDNPNQRHSVDKGIELKMDGKSSNPSERDDEPGTMANVSQIGYDMHDATSTGSLHSRTVSALAPPINFIKNIGQLPSTLPELAFGKDDGFLKLGANIEDPFSFLYSLVQNTKIYPGAPLETTTAMCGCRVGTGADPHWPDMNTSEFAKAMKNAQFTRDDIRNTYASMPPVDMVSRPKYKDIRVLENNDVKVHSHPALKGSSGIFPSKYITGFGHRNQFICAMGPSNNNMVPDFWKVVWHEHVRVIIQLARFTEGGKETLAKYWPYSKGMLMSFDALDPSPTGPKGIDVLNTSTVIQSQLKGQFLISELELTFGKITRKIHHCFFLKWPGVTGSLPESVDSVLEFIDEIRKLKAEQRKEWKNVACEAGPPGIVMCSDGLGRTGAFCALFNCIERYHKSNAINIPVVVQLLRLEQPGSILSPSQMYFVYVALYIYLISNKFITTNSIKEKSAKSLPTDREKESNHKSKRRGSRT